MATESAEPLAFKVGDRVKPFDADRPSAIGAYRALRGTVVAVSEHAVTVVTVHWDCDGRHPPTPEPARYLVHAEDGS